MTYDPYAFLVVFLVAATLFAIAPLVLARVWAKIFSYSRVPAASIATITWNDGVSRMRFRFASISFVSRSVLTGASG